MKGFGFGQTLFVFILSVESYRTKSRMLRVFSKTFKPGITVHFTSRYVIKNKSCYCSLLFWEHPA